MATFLLTWNPKIFDWDVRDVIDGIRAGEAADEEFNWTVGRRRSGIGPGDRFFMLRQGVEPRGIVASGIIKSEPEVDVWTDTGRTASFVSISFDVLVNPDEDPDSMIPMDELLRRFERRHFERVQSSGKMLPDDVAEELEQMWAERVGKLQETDDEEDDADDAIDLDDETDDDFEPLTEQVADDELYTEGAVREVSVNAYERSAAARRACIAHQGTQCCVCDFDFEAVYGELGADFIHVHHIVPLADIGEEYAVDPINDLRPICPNCHAMIHRHEPPLTIEELLQIVAENRET